MKRHCVLKLSSNSSGGEPEFHIFVANYYLFSSTELIHEQLRTALAALAPREQWVKEQHKDEQNQSSVRYKDDPTAVPSPIGQVVFFSTALAVHEIGIARMGR